jgi:uncharacterized membrane protein YvbJ
MREKIYPSTCNAVCPRCYGRVPDNANFCPACGKRLKEEAPATTVSRQLTVYLVSLLLPPFGLWYAWKYLKQSDSKSRKIAITAIILTVVALIFTFWTTKAFLDLMDQQIKSLNTLL